MARNLFFPLIVVAALWWAGPLSAVARAQVDVDVDVDLGGTVDDATGAVGDTVQGAVEGIAPGAAGAAATLDQNGAIEAIKSHRALPLEQIMTKVRFHTTGEIVDAQLIQLDGFLLYELKVVEANGDVDELYFYALSGGLVQTN
ncbi:MAG: PepSY domain-containing protein [Devosia sp.]